MLNQMGIYTYFRGTGSSETSWVVVLLVASFPPVGHGQAHVSEASSLVLVLQEQNQQNDEQHRKRKSGLFYFP